MVCRSSDSGRNSPPHIELPVKWHLRLAVRMHSSAEYYRRRGLVAKQRAAHATDLSLKEAFKDVARHWLALAERVEWTERQQNNWQADNIR